MLLDVKISLNTQLWNTMYFSSLSEQRPLKAKQ